MRQLLGRLLLLILRLRRLGLWEWRLIIFVERIHEEFIGTVRLPAPLRLEFVKKNAAAAIGHFERGDLVLNSFGMEQQPALQRIAVLWIARQHSAVESRLYGKGRTLLEHYDGFAGQTVRDGTVARSQFDAEQRAGAEELVALKTIQRVLHRQRQ